MSDGMFEFLKFLGMAVLVIAFGLASYKRGWTDGYGAALREHLDNLERQKTKNWYKRLHGDGKED